MEDAMIINKSAYERGFQHGSVYKSYIKELNESGLGSQPNKNRYRLLNPNKHKGDETIIDYEEKGLDSDGLPYIGKKLTHGSAEFCCYDT